MRISMLITLIAFALISCTKSNDLVNVSHHIQYWKDHVPAANSGWECPGDQTWETDTTLYYNHGIPTGSLVTHDPHVIIAVKADDGMYDRIYFEYLN